MCLADKQHIIKYAQMEMHQSPLDMFEYKTKQEDGTNNTCSSNIEILKQTDEVNDFNFFF